MSAEKNLPIDSDNLIEDDSPIISVNTAKIKKFFVKALPYAIAGIVTAAAGAVAVAISSDSDDDVDPIVIDRTPPSKVLSKNSKTERSFSRRSSKTPRPLKTDPQTLAPLTGC